MNLCQEIQNASSEQLITETPRSRHSHQVNVHTQDADFGQPDISDLICDHSKKRPKAHNHMKKQSADIKLDKRKSAVHVAV